jgi:predicted PurR-regulated permease PerM
MAPGSRRTANWLISGAGLLALLIVGRPLLVPLAFALVQWAILNALTGMLRRLRLPAPLAWLASLSLIAAGIYLVVRILAHDAVALAAQAPTYIANLERLLASWLAFLQVGPIEDVADLINRSDAARIFGRAASSLGNFAIGVVEVLIYVGFLLLEQRHLPAKLVRLKSSSEDAQADTELFQAIARQLQSYLGILTVNAALMAVSCYVVLTIFGVGFAEFWSLALFVLTYIPAVGAVSVVFPALMALAQLGTLGPAVIIVVVLGAIHLILFNIAQAVVLGRSLDLSPLAIILSLTFWGLVWGIAGLFLAVPITAAIAITCRNIAGLEWVAILLGATASQGKRPARPGASPA